MWVLALNVVEQGVSNSFGFRAWITPGFYFQNSSSRPYWTPERANFWPAGQMFDTHVVACRTSGIFYLQTESQSFYHLDRLFIFFVSFKCQALTVKVHIKKNWNWNCFAQFPWAVDLSWLSWTCLRWDVWMRSLQGDVIKTCCCFGFLSFFFFIFSHKVLMTTLRSLQWVICQQISQNSLF